MLVIGLIDTEDTKVGKEGEKANGGYGSSDGSGIVFLDPSLEEMVREISGITCRFYGRGKITIEDRNGKKAILSNVGLSQIDQGISEGDPLVYFLILFIISLIPNLNGWDLRREFSSFVRKVAFLSNLAVLFQVIFNS